MFRIKFEGGQVILLLLLAITVGLGVGLSIVQRSISNVSTSTKVEESQRAFSAAEAGIERALLGDYSGADFISENLSEASVETTGQIPGSQQAFEEPNNSKEDTAQMWLASPADLSPFYTQGSFDVYWGKSDVVDDNDKPAISLRVIYYLGGSYQVKQFFFDPVGSRRTVNGFSAPGSCSNSLSAITTSSGTGRTFYCKTTISGLRPGGENLIVVRARLSYSDSSHPIAFVPTVTGGCVGCSFPPQARIITSTGQSGSTQRRLQLFVQDDVVPWYFDYALFSLGEISK
ncbi:MAG: pilus assembly PilX N-terminal domain-containing protein [Candidatus Daviesbacteria bacterium]|nr:pilus assembly PilX N-terminal domain-containing protein [Candidatus Daviesbacteria bacterium]